MVISSALFGIFQSIGKPQIPLVLMIISVLLKLILNPILISIPMLNISGAALSSVIGYAFTTFFGIISLKKHLPQKIGIGKAIFPNLINGIICGICAKIVHECVKNSVNELLSAVISVISGVVICAIFTILFGGFRTNATIQRKNEKK